MNVDTAHTYRNKKKYTRHLLRESFRENGKVKHRTIANLSHCSDEEIAAIKLALSHKSNLTALGSIEDLEMSQGPRVGAVLCLNTIAHRLGLPDILGYHRQGKLALWQIFARLIDQGSRLSAVRLAQSHAICELIGLDGFNEDHLYENLAWLAEAQTAIEKRLFKRRYAELPPQLFLYDVTSSYLEGEENALAEYGYNRDGKKGKKQIVIGLLTGPDGAPVAVRVFEGNTADSVTVGDQIKILAKEFGVTEVTLVGDRGMIKGKQIELLNLNDFHYISAITKPQIRSLLGKGVIQLGMFDEKLCEVTEESTRYILRRNPVRQQELTQSRDDRLRALTELARLRSIFLAEHPRAKTETALKKLRERCSRYGFDDFVQFELQDRTVVVKIDEQARAKASSLDGCYVIRTDLPIEDADAATIHARYKDLALIEKAFRTWKTGHLEVRPVFVRTEASTRGHVFVVMLAYLIERELATYWKELDLTVVEGIDELGALCSILVKSEQVTIQRIPQPTSRCLKLLEAADVRLPNTLPARKVNVATKRKLPERRKKVRNKTSYP